MTLTRQLWDKSLPLIRPLLIVVKVVVMTPAPAFSRLAERQAMSKSLAHNVVGISFVNTRKPRHSAEAIFPEPHSGIKIQTWASLPPIWVFYSNFTPGRL